MLENSNLEYIQSGQTCQQDGIQPCPPAPPPAAVSCIQLKDVFTMAFCLKVKAMVKVPPVYPGDISILRGWVMNRNIQVCKGFKLSAVVLTVCSCVKLS